MKNYSIEYAHFYVDSQFNDEHIRGIETLNKVLKGIINKGATYSTNILIDNYNAQPIEGREKNFWNQLKKMNSSPDFYAYEADLRGYIEAAFSLLSKKTVKSYKRYIDKNSSLIPCSLFIIIWYFLRFGIIEDHNEVIKRIGPNELFVGDEVITVLPNKFIDVETIAIRNIEKSSVSDYTYKIQTIFF